jgi:haloalkane dehalogenase
MDVYRTPDERFEDLPDFPFEPAYETVGDLRLARVDTGDGPPVVMLHGEPAWSLIWRKVIPLVRDAGYRCVALDHAGFGRSDKPLDPAWHSLERHVGLTSALLERLDLRDVTLVVHDWGGPIGLNIALMHADRVAGVVILDTALDPREPWTSETWVRFRDFLAQGGDLPVGEGMRATCLHDPGEDIIRAYDAPHPTPESKAAFRGLPMTVRRDPDAAELAAIDGLHDALRRDPRPMLTLWAEDDLFLTLASGQRLTARIGRTIDHVIADAGHGVQEDQGELVGALIADWLRSAPR